MTVRDALNRGYNLVGTAIIAISGLAFFPEFFTEDELTHRLDEGVHFLLAISSIVWYLLGKNKFSRTIVPILLRFSYANVCKHTPAENFVGAVSFVGASR